MLPKTIVQNCVFALCIGLIYLHSIDLQALTEVSYALPGVALNPNDCVFSPNGSYFATANKNSVSIFTVSAQGSLVEGLSYALPPSPTKPSKGIFSLDGSYFFTANNNTVIFQFLV